MMQDLFVKFLQSFHGNFVERFEKAINFGEKPSGGFGGPDGDGTSSNMGGGMSGGINSSSYHMASFDYAYHCVAVMEWLFAQTK